MTANAGWDISLWDDGKWDEILLIAGSGSYSLDFQNVTATKAIPLDTTAGAYSLDFKDVYATRNITLSTTVADFNISGQFASLLDGRVDVVNPANLAIFGPNSGLLKDSVVGVTANSYSIAPSDVSLYKNWLIDTQAGVYTISGSNASLITDYLLNTSVGGYVISGQNVSFTRNYVMNTSAGAFALDGLSADLMLVAAPAKGTIHHFSAQHFLARHFAAQHIGGGASGVAVVSKHGGDDAFHDRKHKGWDKKAWQKKKEREDLFAETIAKTYEQIMGIEPPAQIVEEVAKQAIIEQPKIIQVPYPNYKGLEEWLQSQQELVKLIIQKRIQDEDEEDIEMLLLY